MDDQKVHDCEVSQAAIFDHNHNVEYVHGWHDLAQRMENNEIPGMPGEQLPPLRIYDNIQNGPLMAVERRR